MKEYRTELFAAMQSIGKGNCDSAFANLVINHKELITDIVKEQIDFLADVIALPNIHVVTTDTTIVMDVAMLHYIVTNIDFEAGTASVANMSSGVALLEYCDGLVSVNVAGELIFIIPFKRK